MTFVSYAQNFEDVMLRRALRDVERGFYIDVGAAHPDTESVTRAFYDLGWHGINVEPTAEDFRRLLAARPRDVNLRLALGEAPGPATLFAVPGTGLSTLRPEAARACAQLGMEVRETAVTVETLAELCRRHAPPVIHFLKVDVEGAEREVLAGADFGAHRPWIVLVETTRPMSTEEVHAEWEPLLLEAGYRFAWFDGLNRFYVAAERHDVLAPHFRAPPNVFDDFVRVGDSDWARRIHEAEGRAAELRGHLAASEAEAGALRERVANVERWAKLADSRAVGAYGRLVEGLRGLGDARLAAAALDREVTRLGTELDGERAYARDLATRLHETWTQLQDVRAQLQDSRARHQDVEAQHRDARARLAELNTHVLGIHASTSWRMTGPLRRTARLVRQMTGAEGGPAQADPAGNGPADGGVAVELPPAQTVRASEVVDPAGAVPAASPAFPGPPATELPAGELPATKPPARLPATRPVRTIHQFHSGSALHDAITNGMLLTRDLLRRLGYESDIFVEFMEPLLARELRPATELPLHPEQVLIVRHSIGHGMMAKLAALPMRKVLMYHNITPPEFLSGIPGMPEAARLGRQQLALLRPLVSAALADSAYNAIELRGLGFDPVEECTLLFDLDAMLARAAWPRPILPDAPFTVLFAGRVTASKGQRELIAAFARFRDRCGSPCRLVLAGKLDDGSGYLGGLHDLVRGLGLEEHVLLTGLVPDEELQNWLAVADLYVSLSSHEGFGVPLVEAMAQGVPVLAWPAGAVPYTLGGAAGLLRSREPDEVAARMLDLARDPGQREALVRRQREVLERFRVERQVPALLRALALAGAAPPANQDARPSLAANLRVTVVGHTKGTYSLSEVNRSLALAMDAALPGRVRLVPWDSGPAPLGAVPVANRARLEALAARPPFETGPEVVVSNHYPLHPPDPPGDLPLALFYWEESLVPSATIAALEAGFRGVLAPSRFVAKALTDSGLSLPVRVIGQAPDLGAFRQVAAERGAARRTGDFTFLHVSSCFPRKGLDVLLAGYAAAFRASDPVRLLVKTFPNPHNDAAEQIAALRARDPGAPAVELVDRDLDGAALLRLYRDADAMVLPTRGEGFNMPAAEAMAAELPLIVTGGGGHADFLDGGYARLLDWRHAASGSHLATPGSLWLEPDATDLALALRQAVAERGTGRLVERTGRAAARIATHADPAALAARLRDVALDLLLSPPATPLRVAWISSWGVRCGVGEYSRHLVSALPNSPALGELVVLADERAEAREATDKGPRVRPCWRVGDAGSVAGLARAVAQEDPGAVVVQHQPGLIGFAALAALLRAPEMSGRVTCVTLHNTRHLLDVPDDERSAAVAALAGASRVVVHTVADLHRLQALGLVDNVAMVPQGAAAALEARPPRDLPPTADPLVGCYGFFLPGKGIPQLVEAVRMLRVGRPGLRLRLVNADYGSAESAAEIAACRAAVEAAGMAEAVEWFTGFLPDPASAALLRECDVVALPVQETKEASSASLRAALAAATPVLVTPIPIFDEAGAAVVRSRGTGPDDLARGLDALLGDRCARERVVAAAGAWLAERSWSSTGRRTSGLLLGLAAARSRSMIGAGGSTGHAPGP